MQFRVADEGRNLPIVVLLKGCSVAYVHVVFMLIHSCGYGACQWTSHSEKERETASVLVLSIILNMQLCNILFNIFGDNTSVL